MPLTKASGKNVHIIEGEPESRCRLVQLLKEHGHTVSASANGQEALDRLRAEAPPDLILLDPFTPVLDGRQFRRTQLKDPRLARVPVVVLAGPGKGEREGVGEGEVPINPGSDGVYLPRPVDSAALLGAVEKFARRRQPQILIVDDQGDLRRMLERVLHYYGFLPRLAADGPSAIEVFLRHRPAIDLVLLDVQMAPLDGPQTLAALREIDPQIRAVFMSGYTGKYSAKDLLALGATAVFAKPFDVVHLTEELYRALDAPQAANGGTVARPA